MALYQELFAQFYDPFMHDFEKSLFKKRKQLLSNLKGKILGVGEGTGVNFEFYPKEATIIAVEPSEPMLRKAREKDKHGNILYYNLGICDPKLDAIIEDKSVDAIVSTLVLCTIPDPEKALQNFKRWLKPDGKLIIMEHIHATKPINKSLQNLFNPVWKAFSEGCNLNRNTDKLIKDAGFEPIEEEYFKRTLRFHSGVFKLNKK